MFNLFGMIREKGVIMELSRDYERALKCPYDGLSTNECSKERLIALAILSDLTDRKGIKSELYQVDEDIRIELIESLAKIIKEGIDNL